jgi:biopolymer transport protein ExbB
MQEVPRRNYVPRSEPPVLVWLRAKRIERSMTLCHKYRAILAAAAVAVSLVLPATVFAQTPPSSPSAADPTAATVPQLTPAPSSTAPAVEQPAASPAISPDIALRLPRDLSPWGMFMAADIVVKAVMVGLAFASVLTWTIWFAKAIELMTARRRMRAEIVSLAQVRTWNEVGSLMNGRGNDTAALLRAADDELRLSADAMSPEGLKERIASRLERLEAAAGRQMIRGTGILATIGATAPFVGLFGTVWGIMNSFIGISKSHTTNLAVVAPGIAEALLATALGLVAAIPAVVMYNMFSRWIAGYRALHADAAAEILRIISRDLDRGTFNQRPADRRRSISAVE